MVQVKGKFIEDCTQFVVKEMALVQVDFKDLLTQATSLSQNPPHHGAASGI